MGTRCADHVTPLYPQKLALISPTGGGCSVGIVRSRTKATEFSLVFSTAPTHRLYWHTRGLGVQDLDCLVCVICISFPRLAKRPGLSPFYDLLDPNVSSSLGHRVPAAVNLSLPHSTSILLTRTKVYGYKTATLRAELRNTECTLHVS